MLELHTAIPTRSISVKNLKTSSKSIAVSFRRIPVFWTDLPLISSKMLEGEKYAPLIYQTSFHNLLIKPQMIQSLYQPKSKTSSDPIFSKFLGTPIVISRLVPPGLTQFVDTGSSWDKDMPSAGKISSNSRVDIARVHGFWIV